MKVLPDQCRKPSQPVTDINFPISLRDQMAALCVNGEGNYKNAYAIAHCQVDHDNPLRFFVFADGRIVMNPKIVKRELPFWHKEGCMSFPFRGLKKMQRFGSIEVVYLGEDGQMHIQKCRGTAAAIYQHEIDHMNGISIYDK